MAYIANHLLSQENHNRLENIFSSFDTNKDGVLDRAELINGYEQLGKSKKEATRIVNEIMEKIDLNNNGTIEISEFLMANLTQEDATSQDKLKQAFHLFDKVPATYELSQGWERPNIA
jgi:calcium-dependent protein kinase